MLIQIKTWFKSSPAAGLGLAIGFALFGFGQTAPAYGLTKTVVLTKTETNQSLLPCPPTPPKDKAQKPSSQVDKNLKKAKEKPKSRPSKVDKSQKTLAKDKPTKSNPNKTVLKTQKAQTKKTSSKDKTPEKNKPKTTEIKSKARVDTVKCLNQDKDQAKSNDKDLVSQTDPLIETPVSLPEGPLPYVPQPITANTEPSATIRQWPKGSESASGPLSKADIALYKLAFSQVEQGDFESATQTELKISDPVLIGHVEFNKLFHKNYQASYNELLDWIQLYGDLPQAMRVWNLAKRKKPAGAADPAFPVIKRLNDTIASGPELSQALSSTNSVSAPLTSPQDTADVNIENRTPKAISTLKLPQIITTKSARSAYNDGKLELAIALGQKNGDRFVSGLAAYRLGRWEEARQNFDYLLSDESQGAWSLSGAAYWAGRCADRLDKSEMAESYFRIAASYPITFYGLLAEQRLGAESAIILAQKGLPPRFNASTREQAKFALRANPISYPTQPQARRIHALVTIGRHNEARSDIRNLIQSSENEATRDQWTELARSLNISLNAIKPGAIAFDPSDYPIPEFSPKGGFKLDRALLLAIARKESRFNPKAHSFAGAYGLMQLMPTTAALMAKDDSLRTDPNQLLDPSLNMSIAQDYLLTLLNNKIVSGDLIRVIAAYNAGPRPVQDALRVLGPDPESLLMMESIPVAQTRSYVEEVITSYWIYQKLLGRKSHSLAQAAKEARKLKLIED